MTHFRPKMMFLAFCLCWEVLLFFLLYSTVHQHPSENQHPNHMLMTSTAVHFSRHLFVKVMCVFTSVKSLMGNAVKHCLIHWCYSGWGRWSETAPCDRNVCRHNRPWTPNPPLVSWRNTRGKARFEKWTAKGLRQRGKTQRVWNISGRTLGKGSSGLKEDYCGVSQEQTSEMSVSLPRVGFSPHPPVFISFC